MESTRQNLTTIKRSFNLPNSRRAILTLKWEYETCINVTVMTVWEWGFESRIITPRRVTIATVRTGTTRSNHIITGRLWQSPSGLRFASSPQTLISWLRVLIGAWMYQDIFVSCCPMYERGYAIGRSPLQGALLTQIW
jgi:hypothetical protein